jgi:PAS domain S-box-containing protein
MAVLGLDGRFLQINAALSEVTGYSEIELMELNLIDLAPADSHEEIAASMEHAIRGDERDFQVELQIARSDGRPVWVVMAISFVPDEQGNPRYLVVQLKDITDRKEAQATLRDALREKEQLVAELQRSANETTNLRSKLLTICAWTKRVRCGDRWMPVDEFLVKELGLNLTHGMSAEAEAEFMKSSGLR